MKTELTVVQEEMDVFLDVLDGIIAVAAEGGDAELFHHPLPLSARVVEPAALRAARYVQ